LQGWTVSLDFRFTFACKECAEGNCGSATSWDCVHGFYQGVLGKSVYTVPGCSATAIALCALFARKCKSKVLANWNTRCLLVCHRRLQEGGGGAGIGWGRRFCREQLRSLDSLVKSVYTVPGCSATAIALCALFARKCKSKVLGPASNSPGQLRLPSHAIYAIMAARVGSISDNALGAERVDFEAVQRIGRIDFTG
jgi:hypothetical protein